MKRVTVRFAEPERDAAALLRVYAPYIVETAITFETEIPAKADFETRVRDIGREFPYLVMEIDGEVAGYAYAHRQAERAAYAWNAELSIYLAKAWRHKGLGIPLYALLIELLTMQGYVNLYAVITAENEASMAMHRRMGFREIGLHERTGFKLGRWHDVAWMAMRTREGDPGSLLAVGELQTQEVLPLMKKAQERLEERLKQAD